MANRRKLRKSPNALDVINHYGKKIGSGYMSLAATSTYLYTLMNEIHVKSHWKAAFPMWHHLYNVLKQFLCSPSCWPPLPNCS